MKYLEEKDLKVDSYYLIKSYDGDFAVLQYFGFKDCPWAFDQNWERIRFVIKEINIDSFFQS